MANTPSDRGQSSYILLLVAVLLAAIVNVADCSLANCEKPTDVIFILDTSNSIWRPDFHRQLDFVKSVVNRFTVGEEEMRVGVITFGDYPRPQFNLNRFPDKRDVKKAIDRIKQDGGIYTFTADAIRYMRRNSFLTINGGRENATKIGIVITDGLSYDSTATFEEAEMARLYGIHMFAIGVGRHVDESELALIASQPLDHYSFMVQNYEGLKKLREIVAIKACTVTNPPTTTTATTTPLPTTTSSTRTTTTTTPLTTTTSSTTTTQATPTPVTVPSTYTHVPTVTFINRTPKVLPRPDLRPFPPDTPGVPGRDTAEYRGGGDYTYHPQTGSHRRHPSVIERPGIVHEGDSRDSYGGGGGNGAGGGNDLGGEKNDPREENTVYDKHSGENTGRKQEAGGVGGGGVGSAEDSDRGQSKGGKMAGFPGGNEGGTTEDEFSAWIDGAGGPLTHTADGHTKERHGNKTHIQGGAAGSGGDLENGGHHINHGGPKTGPHGVTDEQRRIEFGSHKPDTGTNEGRHGEQSGDNRGTGHGHADGSTHEGGSVILGHSNTSSGGGDNRGHVPQRHGGPNERSSQNGEQIDSNTDQFAHTKHGVGNGHDGLRVEDGPGSGTGSGSGSGTGRESRPIDGDHHDGDRTSDKDHSTAKSDGTNVTNKRNKLERIRQKKRMHKHKLGIHDKMHTKLDIDSWKMGAAHYSGVITKGCRPRVPTDLVFAVDSKVGGDTYIRYLWSFVRDVIANLRLDEDNFRVKFVHECASVPRINLDDLTNKTELVEELGNIIETPRRTAELFNSMAHSLDSSKTVNRSPQRRKVGIYVTDGQSLDAQDTIQSAQSAKDQHRLELFGVGVGGKINPTELRSIVSCDVKEHLFMLSHHAKLRKVSRHLAKRLCSGKTRAKSPME